jgi:hypothetical protein
VAAPKSPRTIGWPGLTVRFQVQVGALPSVIASGVRIGVLRVDLGDRKIDVVLRTARRFPGPR